MIITDTNITGATGIFVVGGGVTVLLGASIAHFTTAAGTAGKINVYSAGGTQTVTIENKMGSSLIVRVMGLRNRASG